MRHTMGRYIDSLNDEQRDRLIRGEFNDGTSWGHMAKGCGCLVGNAEGMVELDFDSDEYLRVSDIAYRELNKSFQKARDMHKEAVDVFDVPWCVAVASVRYPQAVKRFGQERVVRAVKMRAAKNYTMQLPKTGKEAQVTATVG